MKGRAAIFTEKLKLLSHKFPLAEINTAFQWSLERKVRRAAIVMN